MKKLLKRIMALSLCACMMMGAASPASAAEPRAGDVVMHSKFVGVPLMIESYEDDGQFLNIYANNLAELQASSSKNVTTWPEDSSDVLQKWRITLLSNGWYRIDNAIANTYSLDFYWGSGENYHNCQVYNYPSTSTSYDDFAVTFRNENPIVGINGYEYGIVKVRSTESTTYAMTITDEIKLSGYNVKWIIAPQDDNSQIWTLHIL